MTHKPRATTVKQELRRGFLYRREKIPPKIRAELSLAICKNLQKWLSQKGFHTISQVFTFTPHKGEPDLTGLNALFPRNLIYGLPVIAAKDRKTAEMEFHEHHKDVILKRNQFGIPEPHYETQDNLLTPNDKTLILVPAVAIDKKGFRLGFGKGYYDRYLKKAAGAVTVGVIFKEFFVEELPQDEFDVPVAYCATEQGVTRTPS